MFDKFPLLLKEGWPDHFLLMIQMLIPAGVVDYDIHHGNFQQPKLQIFMKHKKANYGITSTVMLW
jgi:hypothetical protein